MGLRAEEYSEKGRIWWKGRRGEKRYAGVKNLKNRETSDLPEEWIEGNGARPYQ